VRVGTGDWPFVLDEQETALWTCRVESLVFTRTYGRSLIADPHLLEMGDGVRQGIAFIDR
jgi:hypothetical protein